MKLSVYGKDHCLCIKVGLNLAKHYKLEHISIEPDRVFIHSCHSYTPEDNVPNLIVILDDTDYFDETSEEDSFANAVIRCAQSRNIKYVSLMSHHRSTEENISAAIQMINQYLDI